MQKISSEFRHQAELVGLRSGEPSYAWDSPLSQLADEIAALFKEFLPKLVYPIRWMISTFTVLPLPIGPPPSRLGVWGGW